MLALRGQRALSGWLAFAGFSTSSRWQVQIAVVVLELASVLCLRACWGCCFELGRFFRHFCSRSGVHEGVVASPLWCCTLCSHSLHNRMKRQIGRKIINLFTRSPSPQDWAAAIVKALEKDIADVVIRVDCDSLRTTTVTDALLYLAMVRAGLQLGLADPLADVGSDLYKTLEHFATLKTALLDAARVANKVLNVSVEYLLEFRNVGEVTDISCCLPLRLTVATTSPRRPRSTTRTLCCPRRSARPCSTSALQTWPTPCASSKGATVARNMTVWLKKLVLG